MKNKQKLKNFKKQQKFLKKKKSVPTSEEAIRDRITAELSRGNYESRIKDLTPLEISRATMIDMVYRSAKRILNDISSKKIK